MDKNVTAALNDGMDLLIEPMEGGHRVSIRAGERLLAEAPTGDFARFLKRQGSILAAAPIEMRHIHEKIEVRVRGRFLGSADKPTVAGLFSRLS